LPSEELILTEIRDIKNVQTKMLCSLAKIEEHLVASDAILASHDRYIDGARANDLTQWKYLIAVIVGSFGTGSIGGLAAKSFL
jgi:hypothetical protein